MQENHNEQFKEEYSELDEILNHQESFVEVELGETYFALLDELESRE